MALFQDHDIGESEQGINSAYIARLTTADWGLYKTLTTNLQKALRFALERSFPEQIPSRLYRLIALIDAQPKSLAWKTRAMVGERVRWYELPEEPR
jgi:hypothetical protein